MSEAEVNERGELILILSDGSKLNCGKVTGADGKGVESAYYNENGELVLKYEFIPAKGHVWGDAEILTMPSCAAGETVYTCTVCGLMRSEEIPATGEHIFGTDGACEICGERRTSEGLSYKLRENSYYELTGTGSCKDSYIVVPAEYKGLPVKTVGVGAFEQKNLGGLILPEGVESIGEGAFYACSIADGLVLPDSVESVGASAFSSCELPGLTIGSGLREIGENAFIRIELEHISVHGENSYYTVIENCLIERESGTLIWGKNAGVIPEGVKTIVSLSFDGSDELIEMTVPDSVESLGTDFFYGCGNLYSLKIGSGVKSIGANAFADCSNLRKVILGSGIESIGEGAFENCTYLWEICNLSPLPIAAGEATYGSVAKYAKNVYTPAQGEAKMTFTEEGFVFYGGETEGYSLIGYCGQAKALALPQDFEGQSYSVADRAFYGRSDLTGELIIGDGVVRIGESAFEGCTGIGGITIGSGLKSIGDRAFYGCSALTAELALASGTESIGAYAFAKTNIKSVFAGIGLTTVGEFAFESCPLYFVYYEGSEEQWNEIAIEAGNEWFTSVPRYYNREIA